MSWFKKNKTKKKLVTVSAVLAPVKAPVAVVKGKCFWLIFVLKNISLIFGWEDWGMWSQKKDLPLGCWSLCWPLTSPQSSWHSWEEDLAHNKVLIQENLILPCDFPLVEGSHPHSHLDCLVRRHLLFFSVSNYQMCVPKNSPFKWVFVSCSFLVSCFLVVKRCKVSRCIGRPRLGSVSPGGIGQNCLQAQLRSVQGPRGSSCVSN